MSLNRIRAILLQEYYVTVRSIEVITDIFFFPIMMIIVFGFLSSYLSGAINPLVGKNVLMGMLLWQIITVTQYSVSVGSLWNIWSRNLSNMFITPLTIREYIFAHIFSGVIKAILVFLISSVLCLFIFHFSIYTLGATNLFFFFLNLIIFAFSVGLIILGLIFRFGTRIQAFAWGVVPLFQPLTAAIYPLSVLPSPLREIAYIFPPTYIFEAARASLKTPGIHWDFIFIALCINIVYVVFALLFFRRMFQQSKDSGQFARNES